MLVVAYWSFLISVICFVVGVLAMSTNDSKPAAIVLIAAWVLFGISVMIGISKGSFGYNPPSGTYSVKAADKEGGNWYLIAQPANGKPVPYKISNKIVSLVPPIHGESTMTVTKADGLTKVEIALQLPAQTTAPKQAGTFWRNTDPLKVPENTTTPSTAPR